LLRTLAVAAVDGFQWRLLALRGVVDQDVRFGSRGTRTAGAGATRIARLGALEAVREVLDAQSQARHHAFLAAFVLGVLVLDREHVVVARLLKRPDERSPINRSLTGHTVPPPA